MQTYEEVAKIQQDFQTEYSCQAPYSNYINGVGLSKVGAQDKNAPVGEKNDWCICVMLLRPLPTNIVFPEKYHGIRVFVKAVGKITAC